uniref:Uncharacterized protein n=1 Tax=Rhizophora mucronata TaxID=61149 RepID=A0A2P2QT28_RHIMU
MLKMVITMGTLDGVQCLYSCTNFNHSDLTVITNSMLFTSGLLLPTKAMQNQIIIRNYNIQIKSSWLSRDTSLCCHPFTLGIPIINQVLDTLIKFWSFIESLNSY